MTARKGSAPETAAETPATVDAPLQRIAASPHGMVATAHFAATEAGAEMLADGGNAVDAAVASAFALGVCEPNASGVGGQTMMMVYDPGTGKTVALDGSSRAPSRTATEAFAKKGVRLFGHRATTVPSTPAVLAYAARRYGTLPLPRLLEPAIRLAEEGYRITALQRRLQQKKEKDWAKGNAGTFFLAEGGVPQEVGATFRQPVLAGTLRRLAEAGVEDFYLGDIAAQIEADMLANGGSIRRDDLAMVPWPIERRPVSARFEGHRVLTFPPPGAGRTLVLMLNVLSHFPQKLHNPDAPGGALLFAEVIRRIQLDRRDRPYDPNFYPQVEERRLTSSEYAALVAKQIRARMSARGGAQPLGPTDGKGEQLSAEPRPEVPPGALGDEPDRGETTHLSVMDREGMTVGLTQSIERVYGSFAVSPELGFLYNNYMSAFEYKDITNPYYLRPNGVPWASVAPTIVFRGRKPWLVIGSTGSDRITPGICQVLLRLERHQGPLEAVAAPRLHSTVAGRAALEAAWFRDDVPPALEARGFRVDRLEPFSFYMGGLQLVLREGRTFVGVADPRRDGTARGPRE